MLSHWREGGREGPDIWDAIDIILFHPYEMDIFSSIIQVRKQLNI